jgi:anti-anti-sigma regulatory factor
MRDLTRNAGERRPDTPQSKAVVKATAQDAKRDESRCDARGPMHKNSMHKNSGHKKRRRHRVHKAAGGKSAAAISTGTGTGTGTAAGAAIGMAIDMTLDTALGTALDTSIAAEPGIATEPGHRPQITKVVTLAARADCAEAPKLRVEILGQRGNALALDVGRVEHISALTLEVIIAAAKQWASDGQPFRLCGQAPRFDLVCNRLGLDPAAPWICASVGRAAGHGG